MVKRRFMFTGVLFLLIILPTFSAHADTSHSADARSELIKMFNGALANSGGITPPPKPHIPPAVSTSKGVILSVRNLSQRHSPWSNDILGFCSDEKISSKGCLVTCLAMILDYLVEYDYTDPGELNNYLKANNGYDLCPSSMGGGDCCYVWPNIDDPLPGAPSTIIYNGRTTYTNSKLGDPIINSYLEEGLPVLAQVYSSKTDFHFVVIVGKFGKTYWINDPWNGSICPINKGDLGNYKIRYIYGILAW